MSICTCVCGCSGVDLGTHIHTIMHLSHHPEIPIPPSKQVAPPAGITEADLEACRAEAKAMVKAAVDFADASPPPPAGLGTHKLKYIST